MSGDVGADTFRFVAGDMYYTPELADGSDIILDYEVGVDNLLFRGTHAADVAIAQQGEDTVVTYGSGRGQVTLAGVDAADLLAHAQTDFLFW